MFLGYSQRLFSEQWRLDKWRISLRMLEKRVLQVVASSSFSTENLPSTQCRKKAANLWETLNTYYVFVSAKYFKLTLYFRMLSRELFISKTSSSTTQPVPPSKFYKASTWTCFQDRPSRLLGLPVAERVLPCRSWNASTTLLEAVLYVDFIFSLLLILLIHDMY